MTGTAIQVPSGLGTEQALAQIEAGWRALDRTLAERVLVALRATLTPHGHLAQRVTHEHLGYCGWRTESERCVDMRVLIADVEAALEGQP